MAQQRVDGEGAAPEAVAEARFHGLALLVDTPVVIVCRANLVRFANPAADRLFEAGGCGLAGQPFLLPLPTLKGGEIALTLPSGRRLDCELGITATVWNGALAWMACFRPRPTGQAALAIADAIQTLRARFLSHVSHELRTPLNSILGFAELLESGLFGALGPCDESAARHAGYVGDIRDSGRRLLAMTDDLIELAQLEAGELRLQESLFEVEPSLGDIEAAARALAHAPRPDVRLRLAAPRGLTVHGDRARLTRALAHLVANGLAQAKDGGAVTIGVTIAADGTPCFTISDDGPGFSPAALAGAFEPFRPGADPDRADRSAGMGIGLPMARRIFEAHGGSLRIDSRPGRGARVTAVLPEHRRIEGGRI